MLLSKDGVNSEQKDDSDGDDIMAEYDRHHQRLVLQDINEGWNAELRRYLKDMPDNVTANTDLVNWWSVHYCDAQIKCLLC
jgi:hypothetical protein